MSLKQGFFITLEGPEGSGKSSQTKWLIKLLRGKGHAVTFVKDPGSTALGRALRRVLLHIDYSISPIQEALLFIGGRVALVEERIIPALKRKRIVVCDRFHDSTMAYQGYGGELDVSWLQILGRRAIDHRMPSLTILLDLPAEEGFRRLKRRPDRMERKTKAFHRRVRNGFLRLAKKEPRRFVRIDATQPIKEVRAQIKNLVLKRISIEC